VKATAAWGIMRNEESNNLHSSPNIIRLMRERRMWLSKNISGVGGKNNAYKLWYENL
jgi:hypothetical protein